MTWKQLDEQMAAYSSQLISDVKIPDEDSRKLATIIASEVRFLTAASKAEIIASSPVRLTDRLQELLAFQGWMDIVRRSAPSPFVAGYYSKLHFIRLSTRILLPNFIKGSTCRNKYQEMR
jgi:hypothetical protein